MHRNGDPEDGHRSEGVREAALRLGEDVETLREVLLREKNDFVHAVTGLVRERPFGAVLLALGIGYVLGGGLSLRSAGRLIGVGLRIGGMEVIRDWLRVPASQTA
ncbi:MAG: hypothetical protein HY698_22600 [Deltaproteobacteria bacterium]|nr:hypothetical protein [Deltaproteobacteria bacterium]